MTWNQFLWLLLITVQNSYSSFTPSDVLFWDLLKEKVDEMRDCIIQNNIDAAIPNKLCIICWIHTQIWQMSNQKCHANVQVQYVRTMAPSLQQSTFVKGLFKQIQGTINKGDSHKTWQKHAQVTFYSNIKRKKMFCIENVMFYFFCIVSYVFEDKYIYKYIYLKSILGLVFVKMKKMELITFFNATKISRY